jgi:hypothetical protein
MRMILAALVLLALGSTGCEREAPKRSATAPANGSSAVSIGAKESRASGAASDPALRTVPPATPPRSSLGPNPPPAMIVVQKVVVQQEGTVRGIPANITKIGPDNKSSFFTMTDERGVAIPNQPCAPNDRFDVEPEIPVYLRIHPKMCAETLTFDLPSAQATLALIVLGNDASKANDLGKAQVYFLAAANRLAISDAAQSAELRKLAYMAASKSLGVTMPKAAADGTITLTPELSEKLRAFQTSKQLPVTGVLDLSTAQRLGGLDETNAVRRALDVPIERTDKLRKTASPQERPPGAERPKELVLPDDKLN